MVSDKKAAASYRFMHTGAAGSISFLRSGTEEEAGYAGKTNPDDCNRGNDCLP